MKARMFWMSAALAASAACSAAAGEPDAPRLSYFAVPTQENTRNFSRTTRNYLSALETGNTGTVESALAHIAYLGLWMEKSQMECAKKEIESLVVSGNTPAIRYEASLACVALDSPELFAGARGRVYETGEEFFSALSSTMQETLLGYGDGH